MKNAPPPLILASNSPRRSALLRQIGAQFSVASADVDESIMPGEPAEEYVVRVARDKVRVAVQRISAGIVIAADTIVVLDNEIMGKPADAQDAKKVLMKLSGRMHRVITGVAVAETVTGRELVKTALTKVWFRELSASDIASYVASGEPLDKAGAYGIQEKGALLVDKIEGCYNNVVGLPLALLGEMLREFGIKLL